MKDPIKIIQRILDRVFNHLLFHVENEFNIKFGKWSPSVGGIDESINRIKQSKTGNWGNSVEIEGDFSDLYSNCNKNLLISSVKTACKLASLSDNSIDYITLLITCIMDHSYFKEPSGMFKTLKGFSMGNCSAARGSEIILRMSELSIFKTLARNCLQSTINRYLRFRDDVSVHVVGTPDDICKAIKVICTGYPKDIIFNMETKIIQGRFFEYKNIKLSIYNNTIHDSSEKTE